MNLGLPEKKTQSPFINAPFFFWKFFLAIFYLRYEHQKNNRKPLYWKQIETKESIDNNRFCSGLTLKKYNFRIIFINSVLACAVMRHNWIICIYLRRASRASKPVEFATEDKERHTFNPPPVEAYLVQFSFYSKTLAKILGEAWKLDASVRNVKIVPRSFLMALSQDRSLLLLKTLSSQNLQLWLDQAPREAQDAQRKM